MQRDLHFRFRGPVVADMQDCFEQDWAHARRVTHAPASRGKLPQAPRAGSPGAGGDKARLLSSGPDESYERIYEQLLGGLRLAKKTVELCTPYFIPDEPLLSSLRILGLSGVKVRLFVPRRSDHFYMSWASHAYYWDLIEAGVEIWEIQGSFVHSKAAVVDGRWCLVGSCNLDPRSFRLNFEMNVELESPRLARDLERVLRGYGRHARKWSCRTCANWAFSPAPRNHTAKLFSPFL